MNDFLSVFGLVFKRFFRLKKSLVILLVVAVTVVIAMSAITGYQKSLAKSREFQQIDAAKVSTMTNYVHYSSHGAHYLLVPSLLGHLFESNGMTSNTTGRVDAYTSLDISISGKSDAIFGVSSPSPFKLTFIFVILINLFVIFIGGQMVREIEFLKSRGCRVGNGKLFAYLYLSNLVLFTLILLCLFAVVLLVFGIAGVTMPGSDISALTGYFRTAWIMIAAFFTTGVLIGSFGKKKYTLTVLLAVWLISIYFIPNGLSAYIAKKAENMTSRYKIEYEQMDIAHNFEKTVEEKYGKFDKGNMEREREIIELFFEKFYPKIEDLENRLKADIAALVKLKQELSAWFPTTYFLSTSNSVSGNGYDSLMEFYSFLQKKKKEFLRFWIDRVYYNDPSILISFTTEENSNLFHARSTLPVNSGNGSYINLGTLIILFFAAFYVYNRSIFRFPKKEEYPENGIDIELDKFKNLSVWIVNSHNFKDFLYILLSGRSKTILKSGLEVDITLNDADIVNEPFSKTFTYIPRVEAIPDDIKVKELISFFVESNEQFDKKKKIRDILTRPEIKPISGKLFGKLGKREKFDALLGLTHAVKSDVYLIDDIAAGLPVPYAIKLKDRMTKLKQEGALPIYLTTTEIHPFHVLQDSEWFAYLDSWEFYIEGNRHSLETREKLKTGGQSEKQ